MTQHERNREKRWQDHVPSGWALQYDKPTLAHRVIEYFYEKLQYFGGERPGRKKDIQKYRSGYKTPAERAYGEDYQVLPSRRAELAKKRGTRQRRGLSPQAEGFDTPLEEI